MLRCLKFAKYLRQHGWEPVVFTAAGAHYPSVDASNGRDIPEGIEVLREPIWEPYAWYKKFTGKAADANVNNVFYTEEVAAGWKHRLAVWIRSNFFIPDARATWIAPAVQHILTYLKDHPVDALLSDGPPHTNTRIATLVSRATGLPWLADFQDPWTQVDYYQLLNLTPWARKRHERMEQEAFRQASLTTIVSPTWREELQRVGGRNVKVLYWGYDPDDFTHLQPSPHQNFTLTHLGIMGYDRNPTLLFRALAHLKAEQPDFADTFKLRLYGQVDHRVRASIAAHGLEENTQYRGNVERAVALQEMVNSHLLLLLQNQQQNARGRIPGKFFEYLAARRPILNLGPVEGDVDQLIRETDSGTTVAYDAEVDALCGWLRAQYARYRSGDFRPVGGRIEAYSHPVLVGQLSNWLTEIAL